MIKCGTFQDDHANLTGPPAVYRRFHPPIRLSVSPTAFANRIVNDPSTTTVNLADARLFTAYNSLMQHLCRRPSVECNTTPSQKVRHLLSQLSLMPQGTVTSRAIFQSITLTDARHPGGAALSAPAGAVLPSRKTDQIRSAGTHRITSACARHRPAIRAGRKPTTSLWMARESWTLRPSNTRQRWRRC